jgi:hypothetical protein
MGNEPKDYLNPDWNIIARMMFIDDPSVYIDNIWKLHITNEVSEMWDTFTDIQKLAIARQAQREANQSRY